MKNSNLKQSGWALIKVLNYNASYSYPRSEKEFSLIKSLINHNIDSPLKKIRAYFSQPRLKFDEIKFRSIFGEIKVNPEDWSLDYYSGFPADNLLIALTKEIKMLLDPILNINEELIIETLKLVYSNPATIYSLEDFFIQLSFVLVDQNLGPIFSLLNPLPKKNNLNMTAEDLDILLNNEDTRPILARIYLSRSA